MVEQHFVSAVFDGDIVIAFAVGVDSHARQRVVVRLEKVLHKAVVQLETLVDNVQVLLFAKRKFHVVVGAIVGEHVAVFAVDRGIDVPFLVKARRGKIEFIEENRSQLVDDGKIHRLIVKVDDRYLDFNAYEALSFFLGRFDKAVVQSTNYFFSCHNVTL